MVTVPDFSVSGIHVAVANMIWILSGIQMPFKFGTIQLSDYKSAPMSLGLNVLKLPTPPIRWLTSLLKATFFILNLKQSFFLFSIKIRETLEI